MEIVEKGTKEKDFEAQGRRKIRTLSLFKTFGFLKKCRYIKIKYSETYIKWIPV